MNKQAKPKLKNIVRTIDQRTGIHYLDAIDSEGRHWMAQMSHRVEEWLCYTKMWHLAPQQPTYYD